MIAIAFLLFFFFSFSFFQGYQRRWAPPGARAEGQRLQGASGARGSRAVDNCQISQESKSGARLRRAGKKRKSRTREIRERRRRRVKTERGREARRGFSALRCAERGLGCDRTSTRLQARCDAGLEDLDEAPEARRSGPAVRPWLVVYYSTTMRIEIRRCVSLSLPGDREVILLGS